MSALPSTTVLYAALHCIYCANLAEKSQSVSQSVNQSTQTIMVLLMEIASLNLNWCMFV